MPLPIQSPLEFTNSICCSGYFSLPHKPHFNSRIFISGVVRTLHERKKLVHCFFTETRPYNQGSRLTAYELVHDRIPATLICDDMVGALMLQHEISAVVTGADRVVANGDTANKIGTYQIAILAKYHGVPFYIAAPSSSIDLQMKSGKEIVIEERSHQEMTTLHGIKIAAEGVCSMS